MCHVTRDEELGGGGGSGGLGRGAREEGRGVQEYILVVVEEGTLSWGRYRLR